MHNKNQKEMKERRKRRTQEEIEKTIMNTATAIIKEKGFLGLTVTGITHNSEIEPVQFYNRYSNLENFIDEYVKMYDYWFSDVIKSQNLDGGEMERYRSIIDNLFHSLRENKIMQELLKLELSTNNETTRRTSNLRELHTLPLSQKYSKIFSETDVDIVAISALMIGGIYYLVLHNELSPFSGIQLNIEKDRIRVSNAISFLCNMLFQNLTPTNFEIISKMREDGIATEKISYYTGVSEDVIMRLFP